MENHLGELWSMFRFLMPGFLGEAEAFRRRFRTPIEKQVDQEVQLLLARRVAPFILRRTKQAVEKDLPPKTEIVHRLDLTRKQREMYESVRIAVQKQVQAEIAAKGLAKSHIMVLDALLKLRQICCDPRLVKSMKLKRAAAADSCKLDALLGLLPEMVEEGRRILLFSQFTSMLDLIEQELPGLGLDWVRLA
jgi:SNF2 family DNA or RNA helicase